MTSPTVQVEHILRISNCLNRKHCPANAGNLRTDRSKNYQMSNVLGCEFEFKFFQSNGITNFVTDVQVSCLQQNIQVYCNASLGYAFRCVKIQFYSSINIHKLVWFSSSSPAATFYLQGVFQVRMHRFWDQFIEYGLTGLLFPTLVSDILLSIMPIMYYACANQSLLVFIDFVAVH